MAALIDHASSFNVEIVHNTLVFFTHVAPRILAKAERYLDERVPGQ